MGVLEIQRRLIALGYQPGEADGEMGPKTEAAIKQFQRAVGLEADGVAGPKTQAELFKVFPPIPKGMKVSATGRAAIAKREGNKLQAYRDSVGIWTIGVGHTAAAGAPAPAQGMTISAAESDAILSRDLAKFEKAVSDAVAKPMAQHEFDAMVSLAFNIGSGAFAKSSLVKKFNSGDKAGAAKAFLSWNKAGGKVLDGLTTRRKAERAQFLGV